MQSSILRLEGNSRTAEKIEVKNTDRSIQVHSCHSTLRELQVLRDQMLDWFATDPTLTPQDVLVMLTDVESYAPFIKGVFGDIEPGAPAIPFTLADRGAQRENRVTFLESAGEQLAKRKQEAKQQSYDDLITRLAGSLGGPSGEALAKAIRKRYRAALIDESQDRGAIEARCWHSWF